MASGLSEDMEFIAPCGASGPVDVVGWAAVFWAGAVEGVAPVCVAAVALLAPGTPGMETELGVACMLDCDAELEEFNEVGALWIETPGIAAGAAAGCAAEVG